VFFAHPIDYFKKLIGVLYSIKSVAQILSLSQPIRYLKYQQLGWVINFISGKAICDAAVLHAAGTPSGPAACTQPAGASAF